MSERDATTICAACGSQASGKFCETCGTALGAPSCRNCNAPLKPGARFCRECGTSTIPTADTPTRPLGAGSAAASAAAAASPAAAGGSSVATYAPWGLAALLLIAVVAYFSGQGTATAPAAEGAAGTPPGVAPFANGGGGGGAPPDISAMSPRERAGRLYDRIMRYVEEGKRDSASFFAPMAMASFDVLGPELDTDARYDYGRVASETGSYDVAFAQADTILKASPDHLLALSLRGRTYRLKGDAAAAETAWKQFLAVKDAELKKNLPEYQAHATDIEQATKLATSK